MIKDTLKTISLIILLSVPVSACGIKPNSVDAPQSADQDNFPRTYPSSK